MTALDRFKLYIGETDFADDQLSVILEDAEQVVRDYCNIAEVHESLLNTAVVDIAVIKYNRIGSEGLTSRGYAGESESYEADLPGSIKRQLNAYRKLKML